MRREKGEGEMGREKGEGEDGESLGEWDGWDRGRVDMGAGK